MSNFNVADIGYFLGELVLGGGILVLFAADLLVRDEHKRRIMAPLAMVALAATWFAVFSTSGSAAIGLFADQVALDPMATFFKYLFLAVTGVTILTSVLSKELPDKNIGEYFGLLISVTFGMFLMASANDLLMVYLGTEMVSIVSYALAGFRLRDRRSSEAALKYVIYGGAASGIMLFGISIVYGLLGSTELTALHQALVNYEAGTPNAIFPMALTIGIFFMLAGVFYKISAVPFHMWSPDVYEGAPTPVTGFLSVGPKAAGFALLIRLFVGLFVTPGEGGFASDGAGMMTIASDLPLLPVIGVIAAVTMTLGNLAALVQDNVKRLLAYSSIAHAGYLLMAFVVLSESAMTAVMFYLVIYFLMNIGAFTVVQALRDRTGGETLDDFKGLGSREPALAIVMVVFLLSLTGLPPLAGFIGKFYLFAAVIERGGFWYIALALVAITNSAVSLYYYMKVAKAMYFATPEHEKTPLKAHPGYIWLTSVLALAILVFGLYWPPIRDPARSSFEIFRQTQKAPVAAKVILIPQPMKRIR